jgi:hypothetical protein
MTGVPETTGPEENEVAGVLTTPAEWRVFLERYGELYVKVRADEAELVNLLDDDQLRARDRGSGLPRGGVKPLLGRKL